MAMERSRYISGIDSTRALLETLKGVPETVRRRALRNAARSLGEQARALAPDDPEPRDKRPEYQDLRQSLKVYRRKSFFIVRFGARHAAAQHERIDYRHERGGQAKFLEQPLRAMQSTFVKTMADEVAKEMARETRLAERRAKRAARKAAGR